MYKWKIIVLSLMITLLNSPSFTQSVLPKQSDTTVVIQLNDKWNLVSLPFSVNDKRVSSNFPVKYAWGFTNTVDSSTYHRTDTMENGKGYWIKMNGSQFVQITGGIILEDTIDVKRGWNLIGSISRPVPKSKLRLIPDGIVNISCYQTGFCSIIEPGKAYFALVPLDGKLIISAKSHDTTAVQYYLIEGWNLVSLPVRVKDNKVVSNFPALYVYEYQNTHNNTSYFHRTDSLINGRGYWMKVNWSQIVWVEGRMILEDTIDVHNGWNLIGSISKPVPVSNLRVIPQGEIIRISGSCGYWWGSCDTVQPGLAYWAKIASDSLNLKLVMSAR